MKQISVIVLAIAVLLLIQQKAQTFTSFGFGDSAGQPLKKAAVISYSNCANVNCHGGNRENDPQGQIGIKSDIPLTGWEPGKSYQIEILVKFPGRQVFGFQFAAFGTTDSLTVGSISGSSLVMARRSTLKDAQGTILGVNVYATHTKESVVSSTVGMQQWNFTWIAPSSRTQNVRFYARAVCANGNGLNSGDFVISTSRDADSSSIAVVSHLEEPLSLSIALYPNPATDFVRIVNTKNYTYHHVTYRVYDMQGTVVKTVNFVDELAPLIDLRDLAAGSYLLEEDMITQKRFQKFVKN